MAKTDKTQTFLSPARPAGVCHCGHTGDGPGSEHTAGPIAPGHGACTKCSCTRFTWAGWTQYGQSYADALVALRKMKRAE